MKPSAVPVESVTVKKSLIDRLANPVDPALRARVLTGLLDYPANDPDVVAARRRIIDQPFVRAALKGHNGDGTWDKNFYSKYRGTSWTLLHLSELDVPGDHPAIQRGVEYLLATAKPVRELKGIEAERFKGCEDGVYWKYPIACLTGHMAAVLARYDHASQPITRAALATCNHLFDPEVGFRCMVIDHSLLPGCVMTVPKVLKAFLALPPKLRTRQDRQMIEGCVSVLKKFHLYRYAAKDSRAWGDWAIKASAQERRDARPVWWAEGRVEPRRAKEGWLKFSFPHGYNSDLLEVLYLIAQSGAERDEIIDEGISIVLSQRRPDGWWITARNLQGKMWADLEPAGKPSGWITYRALYVLKKFGLWRTD